MERIFSFQTSALTRPTRHHIQDDGILHSHRRENLRSYKLCGAFLPDRPMYKCHSRMIFESFISSYDFLFNL
jgi:hypothetical protein